jgi:hypothetical protein
VDRERIREKYEMKLSDAIEAGWKLMPKIEGRYQDWDLETKEIQGACAIGAACYMVRPDQGTTCIMDAVEIFPELREWVVAEKVGQYSYEGPLSNFVSRLNDSTILAGHAPLNPAPSEVDIIEAVRALGY